VPRVPVGPGIPTKGIAAIIAAMRQGRRVGRKVFHMEPEPTHPRAKEMPPGVGMRGGTREFPQAELPSGLKVDVDPQVDRAVRAKAIPDEAPPIVAAETLVHGLQRLGMADPQTTPIAREILETARGRYMGSQRRADLLIRNRFLDYLDGTAEVKNSKVFDIENFVFTVDEAGTMDRAALDAAKRDKPGFTGAPRGSGGITGEALSPAVLAARQQLERQPELLVATQKLRQLLREGAERMQERGYLDPGQELPDYVPMQRVEQIIGGLAEAQGLDPEVIGGRMISQMMRRHGSESHRETRLLVVLRKYFGDLERKVAEDDLIKALDAEPSINKTSLYEGFEHSARLLPGHAHYVPGPGLPGYGRMDAVSTHVKGFEDELVSSMMKDQQLYRGGKVYPQHIVDALERFKGIKAIGDEDPLYRAGREFAGFLTFRNPKNTVLNLETDITMALLMGIEGESMHSIGLMRMIPLAQEITAKGLAGKRGFKGERFWNLLEAEGVAEGTFVGTITKSGQRGQDTMNVPRDFLDFFPDAKKLAPHQVADIMLRESRQFVEMYPRVAAGLEAMLRTGSREEGVRIARKITLPFGAGDPDLSRIASMRFLLPWLRFFGMATARQIRLPFTKGSRVRGMLWHTVLSVPGAMMMWNYQNDEFRATEEGLPIEVQNSPHVVLGWMGKVLRDRNGNPLVTRMRWWLPEEVAAMFGLGNMPSRIKRMVEGTQTPGQFLGSIPREAVGNLTQQLHPLLQLAQDPERNFFDKVGGLPIAAVRTLPQTNMIEKVLREYDNTGDLAGASRQGILDLAGMSRVYPYMNVKKGTLHVGMLEELDRMIKNRSQDMNRSYWQGDAVREKRAHNEMKKLLELRWKLEVKFKDIGIRTTKPRPSVPKKLEKRRLKTRGEK